MMDKKLSLSFNVLSLLAIFLLASVQDSNANVLIRDANLNSAAGANLTSGIIESGSGSGNYELVICGIETDGANPFNAPTPGSWEELENIPCDTAACQLGIWGRAVDSNSSEDVTCRWGDGTRALVAASIRYRDVDINDPIIDMTCSEPDGGDFILGPISSLPGAQILLLQLFNFPDDTNNQTVNFDQFNGSFTNIINYLPDPKRALGLNGALSFDADGVGFPGLVFPRPTDIFDTKICVLSLRMATRAVPTMSEWGLIGFAAFAGIAGVWYLRRRQAIA